jgi:hypothetical protein
MNAKQAKPKKANSRKEVFVMRKETMIVLGLISAVGILLARLALSADKEKPMVKYPDDYRHWTHVKSTVIQRGHPLYDSLGGIHHIYANWRAFKAMKSGKSFTDGAVLVFDLLETTQENNLLVEGPRKFIGIMQRDSKEFIDTGEWGFEEFKGDTKERVVGEPKSSCFPCHEAQKQTGYVFSDYHE